MPFSSCECGDNGDSTWAAGPMRRQQCWLDEFTEGNIEHLAQHGFTPEDFKDITVLPVTMFPVPERKS